MPVLTAALFPVLALAQAASQQAKPALVAGSASRFGNPLECLVEPSLNTSVGSPVDGLVEEVRVNRGDRVTKGQVVARLRSGAEAASVRLSEAQLEFAKRRVERNEALFKKQLISAQERDEMITEVRLREEELKRNEELLAMRTIVSPLDGIVVERKLAPGEYVRADKSVIVRLAQIDPLHVEVIAPATLFTALKVGMPARVHLAPDYPGSYPARVLVVDQLIDAASGTLGVRLQMANPGNQIPAGLKCTASFGR